MGANLTLNELRFLIVLAQEKQYVDHKLEINDDRWMLKNDFKKVNISLDVFQSGPSNYNKTRDSLFKKGFLELEQISDIEHHPGGKYKYRIKDDPKLLAVICNSLLLNKEAEAADFFSSQYFKRNMKELIKTDYLEVSRIVHVDLIQSTSNQKKIEKSEIELLNFVNSTNNIIAEVNKEFA